MHAAEFPDSSMFNTEGDSEAVVAAFHYWGVEAVSRLRGMFAFAIWDTEARELFIARDPFGIKPLFLVTGPGGTAFGSEKKSLLQLLDLLELSDSLDIRGNRALHRAAVCAGARDAARRHSQVGVRLLRHRASRPRLRRVARYFRPNLSSAGVRQGHRGHPLP